MDGIAIADPAIDLAWMLNGFDRSLRRTVLDRYGPTEAVVHRADILHRLGPWWEALYGIQQQRADLVSSGIQGIIERLSN